MPIRELFYGVSDGAGDDIHVLWGTTSPDLRNDRLRVIEVLPSGADAQKFAVSYTVGDVVLEFQPTFRATLVGNEYEGFGIRVNRDSGVVSFTTPAPQPLTPTNFIIEVFAKPNATGAEILSIPRAPIRIHVFTGVRRIWLTPNLLTVRRFTLASAEDTSIRFAVRAEFTDGTVGDISERHAVTWSPASNVGVGVDGAQLKLAAGDAPGAKIEITASWQGLDGKANILVAPPWANEPAMPKAELVDGHPDSWAGTINPSTVPNILLFGDGFIAADVPKLEPIANMIVHHLKTDPLTRPYDLLATSMNFWRVAVPAPARGASVRCEVYTWDASGRTWAKAVPPAMPHIAGGGWNLSMLLYAVGLPLPTDAAVSEVDLHARWSVTMRDPPAVIVSTSPLPSSWSELMGEWKKLATRTFIDEIDGFPGMALGTPPNASETSIWPFLHLHPYRITSLRLSAFYAQLRAANNVVRDGPVAMNALGNVWSEDVSQTDHYDSTALVVAIAGLKGGRGQQVASNPAHMAVSLESGLATMPVRPVVGRNAVTLDFFEPMPESVPRDMWRTMAHELGHAFGLGDEYVESPGAYAEPETSVDKWGNLTTEAAVKAGGAFTSANIKWDWHRARKAAYVKDALVSAGANLAVPVMRSAGSQFAVGDPVFLRQRQWQHVIGRAPITSGPLQVVAVDPETVTVSGALGVAATVFGSGSVLYLPVRDPSVPSLFLNLISPKIAKFINDKNRPLSPWPCVNADQIATGNSSVVPEFDGYDGFWSHRNDVRAVGLYNGGARQGCGIFHPAGQCMMRNSRLDFSEFCHVCRFVLVEMIDARAHFTIDRDYDDVYLK